MSQQMMELSDISGTKVKDSSSPRTIARLPVASGNGKATVTLGKNTCTLTSTLGGEQKSVSIDLSANAAEQAQSSSSIGRFFEVEMDDINGGLSTRWILRCGETGVEICSDALTPPLKVETSGRLHENWCFTISPEGAG